MTGCNGAKCPLLMAVLFWLKNGRRIGDVRREARAKELQLAFEIPPCGDKVGANNYSPLLPPDKSGTGNN